MSNSWHLTEEKIRQSFTNTIYNRGYAYYLQGRVSDLEYDDKKSVWRGKVSGRSLYHVSVEIHHDFVDAICDCPAYDRSLECKHGVAVLFAICGNDLKEVFVNNATNVQKKYIYQPTEQFINLFKNRQSTIQVHNQDQKDVLQIEFTCKSCPESSMYLSSGSMLLNIEMKVGLDRMYVVRNMKEFLKNVNIHHTHEFTKKFTYDPANYSFSDTDYHILRMLQDIADNESFYRNNYSYYWQGSKTNERSLLIPPMIGKEFLLQLTQCNFTFIHQQIAYENISFLEEKAPFVFRLHAPKENEFELELPQLHHIACFDSYNCIFIGGTFYTLSDDQKILLEGVRQNSSLEHAVPITKEQMGSFLSHVLPSLKKIGTIEITDNISDKIIQPPLTSKLWVEELNGRIFLNLEYHYNDWVIDPFCPNQDPLEGRTTILIRDTEKEQEMMALIENAPLKIYNNRLYVEEEETAMYDFLFHSIPKMNDIADIYITDEVRSYIHSNSERSIPVTSMDVTSDNNLLEVHFDMDGINPDDIPSILQAVIEKKKYYRLPDGAFISLEHKEFQNISQLLSELDIKTNDLNRNHLQLPLYRGMQMNEIIKSSDPYTTKRSKAFRNLIQDLKHPESLDCTLPDTLQASLRDYQHNGFQWLKSLARYSLGGILADDMGLGKTVQSIAYLLSEKENMTEEKPFLILAPASLLYNWKNEFEKFAPGLEVSVVAGSPKEREEILNSDTHTDVWITSYPTLRQDTDLYTTFEFHTLILDEAQTIKNYRTKTSEAVRTIRAHKRFALSGTPIENSLDELWAIFQTILPGFFPGQQAFRKLPSEQIARMVRPFILRRLKKEVLKELPDKIESNHISELTQQQKQLYISYLENIRTSLETEGFQKNRIKILAGITRLRQICCHPSLFIENYHGDSSKLEQLLEITRHAISNKKRLLIFSQFSSMLHIIYDQFEKEGICSFYLDGKTPSKVRVNMANRFNQGEKDVFLISLKAGGTGLNLTGADTVILYDLWWNPAIEEQAAGRAHRMGQKNVVQVIRLLTKGTIEEKIYKLQQKKKELIEQVIHPGETMLTSLSEAEIRELLYM
ncbi:SNF2 helicase associated domain-containing protein [Bacillus cereus]|uniref:SNF2 helicase associated domain-containing protein n=1 Tax=Bacillus cereus TaxID=1396 RepID=UPI0018F36EC7|nr:SNF2 helicase associated domain-containing protein [Bacillus cereus]MBJ8024527.1 SNF2 helicase associated domain-containing protein [Bacillus cereus]MBJ8036958.1 SNF2 helicase associated domain-containing protein [Bacillus cereus]